MRRAACVALLLVTAAGVAGAGPFDPSDAQRAAFEARDADEPVGLVRLVRLADPSQRDRWRHEEKEASKAAGGRRIYGGDLDHRDGGTSDPLLGLDAAAVDWFPSRRAALAALDAGSAARHALLAEVVVIPVRPTPELGLLALRGAAAAVWMLAGREVVEAPPLPETGDELGGADLGMTPERAHLFMEQDPAAPLVMLNLNRYRERAHYGPPVPDDADVSGAEAFARYGRRAILRVMERGGRPLWLGTPEPVLVGAPDHPLADAWDTFALVFYPSRLALRDMVSSPDYRSFYPHRVAGLARAVVLPGTPWPVFDPMR